MYILKRWELINMEDWVETPLAVSEDLEKLIEYYRKEGRAPLINSVEFPDQRISSFVHCIYYQLDKILKL